jgi:hypothetical protein
MIQPTARRQKKSIALFKTDILKVFDLISWEFIMNCFKARGFSQK